MFLKCVKSTKPDISENNLDSFLVCFIFIVTFDSFPNYLSVEFPLIVVYMAVQNNDDRRKLISQAIFFPVLNFSFKCNLFACLRARRRMW